MVKLNAMLESHGWDTVDHQQMPAIKLHDSCRGMGPLEHFVSRSFSETFATLTTIVVTGALDDFGIESQGAARQSIACTETRQSEAATAMAIMAERGGAVWKRRGGWERFSW